MRIFVIFLAALLMMWMIVTAAARLAVREALDKPWPENLGTIHEVPKRYPAHKTTSEGEALAHASEAIDISLGPVPVDAELPDAFRQKVLDYLLAQLLKEDDSIAAPPADIEAFLRDKRQAIDAVRAAVNERIDWEESGQIEAVFESNAGGVASVARILGVDALQKARAGDAAAAWDEVHAIYILAAPLTHRMNADAMSNAISMIRMGNGIARKLPPPVPAWWSDVDRFDARHAMLSAIEAQTWCVWNWFQQRRDSRGAPDLIFSAYQDAAAANLINRSRLEAEELASMRNCAVDVDAIEKRIGISTWNMMGAFNRVPANDLQRIRLYDFERDATQRVFAIKEHRPLPTSGRCADGSWTYANGILRYSAKIPVKAPGKFAVPPVLRVEAH